MSDLVFLANAGGQLTVTNENSSGNNTVTIPATNGTLLIEDTSGNLSVTNLTVTGETTMTGTGQMLIPVGNTSQRTDTPTEGEFRFNTDAGGFYEGYQAGEWVKFTTVSQNSYVGSYVVVAGGGGGQGNNADVGGGGGGAGGYLESAFTLIPGTTYYAVIGAGGAPTVDGNNSQLTGIAVAVGGGAGSGGNGNPGGSGGGSAADCGTGGAGTSGQGNRGGNNYCRGGGNYAATGGGGAGGPGQDKTTDYVNGSNGGVGLSTTILGAATFFAGGGGGHGQASSGSGGNGGGGAGNGTSGTANTGGGGGGFGGSGGSGVVLISVPTASYTGTITGAPTVTVNGANTVMKFTVSGTYLA